MPCGNRCRLDPERETLVICHHGICGLRVALFPALAGFEQVANLDGGINAWSREVDPTVPPHERSSPFS
ncbi:MAG: rhodanese-like domain-containing protein [Candidatus Competibacter sp.]